MTLMCQPGACRNLKAKEGEGGAEGEAGGGGGEGVGGRGQGCGIGPEREVLQIAVERGKYEKGRRETAGEQDPL